jgi:hypothetical protein
MINRLTLKKLGVIAVALLIIDLIFSYILWKTDLSGASNLDGTYNEPGSENIIRALVMALLLSLPLLSAILGTIPAIFINRELPYGTRYPKGILLTLVLLYGLMAVSGAFRITAWLIG